MAPKKKEAVPGQRRACIHCGNVYGVQGVVTHERFCKSRPKIQTLGEQLEADAIARILREEINPGMSY